MAKTTENPWEYKPEDVKKALAEDQYDDCLSCRIMGSMALVSLGGWSYYSGMHNLRQQEKAILKSGSKYRMGSRRLGVVTISAALVGMGVWRAFN